MLRALAFLATLLPSPALAQSAADSYLVESSLSVAQARSVQECGILHCDGVKTIYWWSVIPLSNATAAVEVQPSGWYSNNGLTAPERTALAPYSSISGLVAVAAP